MMVACRLEKKSAAVYSLLLWFVLWTTIARSAHSSASAAFLSGHQRRAADATRTTTPRRTPPLSTTWSLSSFTTVRLSSTSSSNTNPSVPVAGAGGIGAIGATELPDSLADAAERAASASAAIAEQSGSLARCRVDFDTSVGDETYTILKSSTEFMQHYVSALCNALVPNLQQQLQNERMRVIEAQAELKQLLLSQQQQEGEDAEEGDEQSQLEEKRQALEDVIRSGGRNNSDDEEWKGPVARIYFPDEGSAALARRDWLNPSAPLVPPCVECSSCGGVQMQDIGKDAIVFFFCPKASESEQVEQILQRTETEASDALLLTVFVNPDLVDMGVTGYGMAGRLLRERLIEPLQYAYYLRTLPWGALTRKWPQPFSIWQEDENSSTGYRLIRTMDRLPSNPEVQDIYDIENGLMEERQSGGLLDQFGDFMNGMMKL